MKNLNHLLQQSISFVKTAGFLFYVLLHLHRMKKKQLIISLSLAVTVLFSILFQSFHSYEHFVKQFAETECHHKYSNGTPEITHQHHNLEDCKVCQFTFGNYVTPEVFACKLSSNYKQLPYFYKTVKGILSFSGSLYSHRGPPFLTA